MGVHYDTDTSDDEASNEAVRKVLDKYPFQYTMDSTDKQKVIMRPTLNMLEFEFIAQSFYEMIEALGDCYNETQWKAMQEILRKDVICAVYAQMADIHKKHVVDLYNQIFSTDPAWQRSNLKNYQDLANDMMDLANMDI